MAELCAPQAETQDKKLHTSTLCQFPAVFIFKQSLQSSFASYQDEYKKKKKKISCSRAVLCFKKKKITQITNAYLNVIDIQLYDSSLGRKKTDELHLTTYQNIPVK